MILRRPLYLVMTAICGVFLAGAAACGSGGGSTSSTTSAAAVQSDQTEEALPPPPAESTGAEQPQSQQNQPSVTLAALPVGGNEVEFASPQPKCVSVSWTGQQPLPDGVRFRITEVVIDKDFQAVGGGSCNDPCVGHTFVPGKGQCEANVAWIKPPGPQGLHGQLGLVGACIAPDAATCQQAKSILAQGAVPTIGLSAPPVESSSSADSSLQENQSSAESSPGSSG